MSDTAHNSNRLCVRDQSGSLRPATHEEILRAANACLARRVKRGMAMSSPQVVREFLKIRIGARSHEVFCALFLDRATA